MSSKTKNLGLFKYDTKTDGKQVLVLIKLSMKIGI